MALCSNCGAQLIDETKYCSSCGAEVEDRSQAQQPQEYAAAESSQSPPSGSGNQIQPMHGAPGSGPGYTAYPGGSPVMSEEEDIQNYKGMAILAYLNLLVLIPIFAAKESKFARFHANQGLVLIVSSMAYSVVYVVLVAIGGIVSALLSAIFNPLFFAFIALYVLLSLVFLLFLVFTILGIVNAATGKFAPLPIIGKFKMLP